MKAIVKKIAFVLVAALVVCTMCGCSILEKIMDNYIQKDPVPVVPENEPAAAPAVPQDEPEEVVVEEEPEQEPEEELLPAQYDAYAWYLADGRNIVYIDNDGLHAMDYSGENDRLLVSGEPDEFYQVWAQQPGQYLVVQRSRAAAETPEWLYNWISNDVLYDIYLLNDAGEQRVLAQGNNVGAFLPDGSMLCQQGYTGAAMLLGADGNSKVLDLPNDVMLLSTRLKGDTLYVEVASAASTWENRGVYAVSCADGSVQQIGQEEQPAWNECEYVTPTFITDRQENAQYVGDSTVFVNVWGDTEYTGRVVVNEDWTAAMVTLWRGEEMISSVDVASVFNVYSYEDWMASNKNMLEYILLKQENDGVYYTSDIERLEVHLVGGWAFVTSNGYTNGVVGGPSQLIAKIPLEMK